MPGLKDLKAEIAKPAYNGKTDAQIVAMLNAPNGLTPKPMDLTVMFGKVSAASLGKLLALPVISTFRDDVAKGDRAAVARWLAMAAANGAITVAERTNILTTLNETVPGSPLAVAVFGQLVSEGDVFYARRVG